MGRGKGEWGGAAKTVQLIDTTAHGETGFASFVEELHHGLAVDVAVVGSLVLFYVVDLGKG